MHREDSPSLSPEDKPNVQDKKQPKADTIDKSRIEIDESGIRLAYKQVIKVFDANDDLINSITLYLSAQNGEKLSEDPNIIH